MSYSNFEWLIVFGDYSTQVVISKSVSDIIFGDLDQSSDDIINIIRLNLY